MARVVVFANAIDVSEEEGFHADLHETGETDDNNNS
jgi:hypothetical protein